MVQEGESQLDVGILYEIMIMVLVLVAPLHSPRSAKLKFRKDFVPLKTQKGRGC